MTAVVPGGEASGTVTGSVAGSRDNPTAVAGGETSGRVGMAGVKRVARAWVTSVGGSRDITTAGALIKPICTGLRKKMKGHNLPQSRTLQAHNLLLPHQLQYPQSRGFFIWMISETWL